MPEIRSCKNAALFLDVDGVLNRCDKSPSRLEFDLLANLARIVAATDCGIVLSSTWRLNPSALEELALAFEACGLAIAGMTPDLCGLSESGIFMAKERGEEIQAWMNENGTPERFCIIDDSSDMAHLRMHLVQTDSFEGLTETIAERVIKMLTQGRDA